MNGYIVVIALIVGVALGHNYGNREVIELKQKLEQLDAEAVKTQEGWELSNEELVKQHNHTTAVLRSRIKRLLQDASNKSTTTTSAGTPNATSCECTSGREVVDIEGCVLDAAQVLEFQQWVRNVGLPIQP